MLSFYLGLVAGPVQAQDYCFWWLLRYSQRSEVVNGSFSDTVKGFIMTYLQLKLFRTLKAISSSLFSALFNSYQHYGHTL